MRLGSIGTPEQPSADHRRSPLSSTHQLKGAWGSVLLPATQKPPILVAGRVMLAMRLLDFFRMGFRWGFDGSSLVAFAFTHLR